jgi:uncharacterized membrane protein YhaH (DUF805 family)
MHGFASSVEPLRRYADFSGRSTRTDIAFFYALTILLNLAAFWVMVIAGDRPAFALAPLVVQLALLCPSAALAVRRLHDSGRGGWWALLGLPFVTASLWQSYAMAADPFHMTGQAMVPLMIRLPLTLLGLAFLVLLFAKDEEGTNLYGPNPRYGEPAGEPA